jgi:hypothetical protein
MSSPVVLIKAPEPPNRVRTSAVSVALALLGWIALALTFVPFSPIRAFGVAAFVLIGPGCATVRLLPARDPAEDLMLVLALSTATAAIVAEACYLAGVGSPRLVLGILATITTVLAFAATEPVRRHLPLRRRDGVR